MRKICWLLFVLCLPITDQVIFTQQLGTMGQFSILFLFLLVVMEILVIIRTGQIRWIKSREIKSIILFVSFFSVVGIVLAYSSHYTEYKGELPFYKGLKQVINLILWGITIYFTQRYIKSYKDVLLNIKFLTIGYSLSILIGFSEFFGALFNITVLQEISMLFHPVHTDFMSNIYGLINGIPRFRLASSEAFQAALVIVGLFPLLLVTKNNNIYRCFLLFLSPVLLFLTFSRAGYLIFFLMLLLYFVLRKDVANKKLFLIFVFLAVTVLTLVPYLYSNFIVNDSMSNQTRSTMFWLAFKIMLEHPIFGVGIGQMGFYYPDYLNDVNQVNTEMIYYMNGNLTEWWPDPNALFPRILAETGLVGICSIFIFMFKIVRINIKENEIILAVYISFFCMFIQQLIGLSGLQLLLVPYMLGLLIKLKYERQED
ncbi:O-antigen ligase family protein [Bacillus paranthracis]|uniref:O-antigen ligase family protein n=1 Tax=Bacillus paranthracis TaxID=2026186 RepID=UPI0022E9229A|nr:O-antigen ligase family protein [Bacillus paranthracis]MED0977710.1 O-antigen ligase family protein [Bacillus paranthracis]MED1135127.1 O-antigen ligase family protein [Bacillus paranthracis]